MMNSILVAIMSIIMIIAISSPSSTVFAMDDTILEEKQEQEQQIQQQQQQEIQQEHQPQEQHPHQQQRHLLADDSECVLYLKIVEFEDEGEDDIEEWSCEFPRAYAAAHFHGGIDIMDIAGIDKAVLDASGAVSGESLLTTKNAYVQQSFHTSLTSSAGGARAAVPQLSDKDAPAAATATDSSTDIDPNIRLVITDPDNSVVSPLPHEDARHHQQRRLRRRRNNSDSHSTNSTNSRTRRHLVEAFGTLKTLVVRPISPNGAVVAASTAKLRNDVFEDDVCLKSQMEACSHQQLTIQAANVGDGGVVEVQMDVNPLDTGDRNANRGEISASARTAAAALYGGGPDGDDLGANYDLVIFCVPTNGRWDAFAYLNRYDSYYNKDRCSISGVLMHEVGHNFGLGHSGTGGGDVYSDLTGYMGAGSTADDGPRKCYNAVKSYEIGWYDQQIASFDPIEAAVGNPTSFVLNGVGDYKVDGSSTGELISLRLEQFGDTKEGVDYYLGYNRKNGPTSGCVQFCDQVILYSKDGGVSSQSPSTRVAMLSEGDTYAIEDYRGIGSTVTIDFESTSNDLKDAIITISATPPPPTAPPTLPCGSLGGFRVEIHIDDFAGETWWKLFEQNTDVVVEAGMDMKDYKRQKDYFEPGEDDQAYCLDHNTCYDFKIYDAYGDGLQASQGGYYRLYLDSIMIKEGAQFKKEELHSFCVGESDGRGSDDEAPAAVPSNPPTKAPTASPTKPPTRAPTRNPTTKPETNRPTVPPTTDCVDDPDFRYKNVKKCNWVGQDAAKRCELPWESKLIKQSCPITCGLCTPPATAAPTAAPTTAPTAAPTTAPTVAPTVKPTPYVSADDGKCGDDPLYKYKGVKKCNWVALDLDHRCALPARDLLHPSKLIRDFCQVTCGVCDKDVPIATPAPTTQPPTVAPTATPTRPVCHDDLDFKYKGAKKCTSGWIANNLHRCDFNAKFTSDKSKLIKDMCPVTCGNCHNYGAQPIQQEVCLLKDTTGHVYENSKGKRKKCSWVASSKKLKTRQSRCRKKGIDGKKVKEHCPNVCGSSAGTGPCKFLIDTQNSNEL